MLVRLRILDYALVDEVEIDFGRGLNVLTGETGAGKSILVDSIELLTGARATGRTIRGGAEEATVEGLFAAGGEEVAVRRVVRRDRENLCYLGGHLATVRELRESGERWIELHGQHDDHLLVRPSVQRTLIDRFAGATGLAEEVAAAVGRLAAIDEERGRLAAERSARVERLGFLRSQVAEIEAAAIDPDEEPRLEAEASRLGHAVEIGRLAGEAHVVLDGDEAAVLDRLAALERHLDRLAELDPELASLAERFAALGIELRDVARELERYAASVDLDPARLAEVEARRDALYRLKRKHGPTLADVVETARRMREEIDELEARDERAGGLEAERDSVVEARDRAATALAEAREAAADRLEAATRDRLDELGMGGGFRVALERREAADGVAWSGGRWRCERGGLEAVAFLVAPNPGEGFRRLAEVASGGELSRVLLALKAALAEADGTPTLVFDEIDAGIGGAVAGRVARQLTEVAGHHQVIVVTHLAQIAAVAHHHVLVEKEERDGRTVTRARRIEGGERVREVSRLLGGDPERDVSIHHAEELLGGRT